MSNDTGVIYQEEFAVEDDYLELESALEELVTDEKEPDIKALEAGFSAKTDRKSLYKRIPFSAVKRSQSLPFLAAVELDISRHNPAGLKDLFITWLEKGTSRWLNPFRAHQGMAVLEEILFKYQGDQGVLRPFVKLLQRLAEEGISPSSFVTYVILPRMKEDNNWKRWEENHLEALQIIAAILIESKNQPPFNQERVGSANSHLSRDVVLVKYIGRPIARYRLPQLNDTAMIDTYKKAWQKISLNNSVSIYFIRLNILHFIFAMSGKIDLVQLVAIIGQLPDIERSFALAFPQNITINQFKNIQNANLFNHDIGPAIQARRQHGYQSLDFTVELRAYLDIIKALLEKDTGIYLCSYYARLLKRYKNPAIAETIARMVQAVDDRGGMHIYKWHTKKLLAKSKDDMRAYASFIEENNGCDPDYPRIDLLFRDEELIYAANNIFDEAAGLGLTDYFTRKKKESISYKDLINAYIEKCPETSDLILGYQKQLLAGEERQWTAEYIQQLDRLGTAKENLHRPLLRLVIRGIGTGFSFGKKAENFSELLSKYGAVHSQKIFSARTRFSIPVKPVSRISPDKNAVAREQINLKLIEKIWQALQSTDPVHVNHTLPYINKRVMDMDKPMEKCFTEKVNLEQLFNETTDGQKRKAIEKNIAKKDKAIRTMQEKKRQYSDIMDIFDSLTDEQKFVSALVLAGAMAKTDDQFPSYVIHLLLQRYQGMEGIASRLGFLTEDISIDILTYTQFTYLLNLLDTLFFFLRDDKKIHTLIEKDSILKNILKPFFVTRKKEITIDALDAAAKKTTEYAALQSERAKWQGILDKIDTKSDSYFHKMEIYTSKSFVDSYYGDMGGICLSSQPGQILKPGFLVQRLADQTDQEITGMSILFLSNSGFSSPQVQADCFWQAFGFNPLPSVLNHCTTEQQLYLYLQFRLNMEKLARTSGLPVAISGIDTSCGLISNNGAFNSLIRKYEFSKPSGQRVSNAKGLSIYYSEQSFENALVIIDPRGYESAQSPADIPTFHAHRDLQLFQW